MDQLVLTAVFLATLALGTALGKWVLAMLLQLIVEQRPRIAIRWRPVVFLAALFWFWYLTPAIAQSPLATRVMLAFAR